MRIIHTEIDIEVPEAPERVWRALLDFASYPEWNPFLRRIEGSAKVGERLRVEASAPGDRPRTFRPTVVRVEPSRELRWLGRWVMPGLFDGEHCFILERFRADRVRFFQREIFRGALVGMLDGTLDAVERGFEEMNRALKARVEDGER